MPAAQAVEASKLPMSIVQATCLEIPFNDINLIVSVEVSP